MIRCSQSVLSKLLAATDAHQHAQAGELLAQLDDWRDDFDRKIDWARTEMRRLAGVAIAGTRASPPWSPYRQQAGRILARRERGDVDDDARALPAHDWHHMLAR